MTELERLKKENEGLTNQVKALSEGITKARKLLLESAEPFDAGCSVLATIGTEYHDPIARLEKWISGHKARSVAIIHGDGYGADCWEVELAHEKGTTMAYQVGREGPGEAVAQTEDEKERDEWPGLAKTIDAAIDAFEAGIYRPGRIQAI